MTQIYTKKRYGQPDINKFRLGNALSWDGAVSVVATVSGLWLRPGYFVRYCLTKTPFCVVSVYGFSYFGSALDTSSVTA